MPTAAKFRAQIAHLQELADPTWTNDGSPLEVIQFELQNGEIREIKTKGSPAAVRLLEPREGKEIRQSELPTRLLLGRFHWRRQVVLVREFTQTGIVVEGIRSKGVGVSMAVRREP